MFSQRNSRHPRGRRQRGGRVRSSWIWLSALGGCAVVAAGAYSLTGGGAEPVASAAATSAVPAGPARVGGWGRGGYPMVARPGGEAANATAVTSLNWSGYAASGTPGTFTSVSTSWTQPAVTCGAASTFSSFWAGLDGDGTTTVEQTGTEADCSNGAATYAGWYEMFPNAPVFYDNPVQAGDAMSASVVSNGGGSFTLTLTDATQNWTQTTQQTNASAQLGSAEIIAEAPSNGTVLPLSNFGTVNFTNATADNTGIGNENASALTMVSASGVTEATPSALTGGNSFTVTWDSSGTPAPAATTPAGGNPSPGMPTSGSPSPAATSTATPTATATATTDTAVTRAVGTAQ
ncbi:MAG TPA: G1 family glutamic endopeptidase [Trebonia sp.]|nr:G1 family glutamic endopeptidase [Trebonia sp.]